MYDMVHFFTSARSIQNSKEQRTRVGFLCSDMDNTFLVLLLSCLIERSRLRGALMTVDPCPDSLNVNTFLVLSLPCLIERSRSRGVLMTVDPRPDRLNVYITDKEEGEVSDDPVPST
jgi:hypothetical protein